MGMTREQFYQTPGGQILLELRRQIQEDLVVPNSWLPEAYHDNVRGGRTLARLNAMCDVRDGEATKHAKAKAAKARNIQKLRQQFEGSAQYNERGEFVDMLEGFDYNSNEQDAEQLSKNMIAMVQGMVNGGLIDADDLIEE